MISLIIISNRLLSFILVSEILFPYNGLKVLQLRSRIKLRKHYAIYKTDMSLQRCLNDKSVTAIIQHLTSCYCVFDLIDKK